MDLGLLDPVSEHLPVDAESVDDPLASELEGDRSRTFSMNATRS
jgi:hypothetical protein